MLPGLAHVKDFERKIPRTEMNALKAYVCKSAEELDPKLILTVCGSYRRGKSESGDIDILITHPG